MALRDTQIVDGHLTPVWRVCDAAGCAELATKDGAEAALCDVHHRQEYGCRGCGELPAVCECDEPRFEPSVETKPTAEWR